MASVGPGWTRGPLCRQALVTACCRGGSVERDDHRGVAVAIFAKQSADLVHGNDQRDHESVLCFDLDSHAIEVGAASEHGRAGDDIGARCEPPF